MKVCTTDTRIICDFRENRHGEGRNFRVRVNEIVLKVVEWECDSLRGKRDLVKTVHCDTECTICSLVSNSIRRYQENTPTEEGGVTAQPEGQRKLNQFYLLLTQTSGSNTKRCQCQHCYTVSALLHSVSAATQCQRCSTVSALLHSVSTATQCQRCYTVSALLHSVSAAPRCERCYTVSVPPHSVSIATQCQHCYKVSALLHNTNTRAAMTNVIAGGSPRKAPSWELPPAATNSKEHSLLLGMWDIRKGNWTRSSWLSGVGRWPWRPPLSTPCIVTNHDYLSPWRRNA